MPNGQYHKKYAGPAVRIKNPLPLTVEITIKDGKGFVTCRSIKPGLDTYVKLPHDGPYDIDSEIMRYDQTGQPTTVGKGEVQITPQRGVMMPATLAPGPVFMSKTVEVKDRRWRNVLVWQLRPGYAGYLDVVVIGIDGDAEALLFHQGEETHFTDTRTIKFKPEDPIGASITIKGRSRAGGTGRVFATIKGKLVYNGAGRRVPDRVTEDKSPKKKEPEEPIRTLGDMMREFEQEEVPA